MIVDNIQQTIKTSTMILKKRELNDIPYSRLTVLFIDADTDCLKVSVPLYSGLLEQTKIAPNSQILELEQSQYRCSFENVTFNFSWNEITDDLFAVVCDSKTREVLQMTQLTNFELDCINYIYQNLDNVNSCYENPMKRKIVKF